MPWSQADVEKITAALALPSDTSGEDVAIAVRLCVRRCQELESRLIAYQDSHAPSDIEARLKRLEEASSWRPADDKKA